MPEEVIKTFKAVDDSGNIHKVLIIQQVIEHKNKGGTNIIRGMLRAETSTGLALERIDKDTFECRSISQRLHKIKKRE